jgi:hypothetical protein
MHAAVARQLGARGEDQRPAELRWKVDPHIERIVDEFLPLEGSSFEIVQVDVEHRRRSRWPRLRRVSTAASAARESDPAS